MAEVNPPDSPGSAPGVYSNSPSSDSVQRWLRLNRDQLRDQQKQKKAAQPIASGPASPASQITQPVSPSPSIPRRQRTSLPTPSQSRTPPPSSSPGKTSQPFALANNFLGSQQSSAPKNQPNSSSSPDAYTRAMATEGGQAGSPFDFASKGYMPQGPKNAMLEQERQSKMRQTQESFSGTLAQEQDAESEESGELIEEDSEQPSGPEDTETEEAVTEEENEVQDETERAQILASDLQETRREAEEEQEEQIAQTKQNFAQLNAQRQIDKKVSQEARVALRMALGVAIPVIGFLVAWNIELIHDRVIPIVPGILQDPNILRELATILLDLLILFLILLTLAPWILFMWTIAHCASTSGVLQCTYTGITGAISSTF